MISEPIYRIRDQISSDGGFATSTFLTIVFIPVLYSAFESGSGTYSADADQRIQRIPITGFRHSDHRIQVMPTP